MIRRILLELLLEKSMAHLKLSIVDKVNLRLTVREKEFKRFMENKSNWYTKCSTSNWHIAHMRYKKWTECKSRYCIAH